MIVCFDILFTLIQIVCITIALFDFLFYRIPNVLVATIIVLFFLLASLGLLGENGWIHLQGALLVASTTFIVGLLFYFFKWMGAGDIKFLATTTLWTSYVGMNFIFLITTSLVGGIIAGICYFYPGYVDGLRLRTIEFLRGYLQNNSFFMSYVNQPFLFVENESRHKVRIPYGVAICSGSVFVFFSILMGQGIK